MTTQTCGALLNLNHAFRTAGFDLLHPRRHVAGKCEQRLRMRRVLSLEHRRRAAVARLANFWIELDASEKGDVELFRRLFRAAAREDIDFVLAMRTDKVTHVFDHADDVHLHLAEHLDGLASILQRNIRWRRDHDRAGQRDSLNQRERNVASSGRKINDKIVKLSPLHRSQKLLNDRMQHGTAPNQRLVARVEKTNRDDLEAMRVDGRDLVFAHNFGLLVGAQHERDVRPVNIAVEQSYFVAHLTEGDCEIDRERGLADSALAGSDGDDGADAR